MPASNSKIPWLILDILIWTLLFPILFFPLIFFTLLKTLVLFLAKFCRPDLSSISNNDLLVARDTFNNKAIVDIGFILKVKGRVSVKALREKFKELFLSHPRNSKTQDPFKNLHSTFERFGGYLFIKEVENLNLEQQIREATLTSDPKGFFSSWLASAYKDDKAPRWEMLLLHEAASKLESQEEFSYVALRMHHGLIDGFGMVLIVDKLCNVQSPYMVPPEPPLTFQEKASLLLELPRVIATYWINAFLSSWPFPTMNNVDKTDKMFLSWATIDLGPMKSLRRKLNVSFSALLYVLQTGALRRHLLEMGRGDEITDTLPVFHTIPKPNHPRWILTNHWTFVKLHTPFGNENPLERVTKTDELYNDFIKTRLHISAPMFFAGFVNLLPICLCILNLNTRLSTYKAALSSMVRPLTESRLFGFPVTNIYHTFCTKDLCPETVLYTTTASHNDQIDFTMAAAPDLVGDQDAMNRMAEKHFKDELQDLLKRANVSN